MSFLKCLFFALFLPLFSPTASRLQPQVLCCFIFPSIFISMLSFALSGPQSQFKPDMEEPGLASLASLRLLPYSLPLLASSRAACFNLYLSFWVAFLLGHIVAISQMLSLRRPLAEFRSSEYSCSSLGFIVPGKQQTHPPGTVPSQNHEGMASPSRVSSVVTPPWRQKNHPEF